MRTCLTSVRAEPVRTVAGRLRAGIDRAAVELATAMRSRRQ
ncbi:MULTISPECIES: hypothetical protein [unclassified Streptomyces]|jgi:hypothetical protein